jgi:outer membrane protein insertion porin family
MKVRAHQQKKSFSDFCKQKTFLLLLAATLTLAFTASAQDNPSQAGRPTQTQPPEPKGTPTQAPAQTPKTAPQIREVLPSYEGQNVTSVELAGQPNLDTKDLLPLLTMQPNQPFSQKKADESIAALKQAGKFHDVQLDVRPETSGVRVLFVLQPATYFGIYIFTGTGRFSYTRLLQVANYPPKGSYNPTDVENARRSLEDFFKRNGYFKAKVASQIQTSPPYGLANVIFQATLNRRAKFGNVIIQGTTGQQRTNLENKLRTLMARLRGSAIRPGKNYKLSTIQKASRYLTNQLAKQGYLDAKVQMRGADYSPETNRANILYDITLGPIVHVTVTGAHLWSWDKKKLLPVYEHAGTDPELIQEGQQNLISYFQSKGYFNAAVTTKVDNQPSGETIAYQINKGQRHKVKEVKVTGNHYYPEKKILSYVKVKQAHILSHGQYSEQFTRASVKNIENLYKADGFSSVKVTSKISNERGDISVAFLVEEGPQDLVGELAVNGNDTLSEAVLAPKGFKLRTGQPYSQQSATADRNQIMATYLSQGYLTATFRETVHAVPNEPHRLQVVYQIYEGPQVKTATVVTLGRVRTKQKLIDRQISGLTNGEPMKEDDLLSSETKLFNTGVFDWAEVDPRREVTTQHQEDVIVKVHETRPNTLIYGLGFDVINRGGSVPSGTVVVPGIPPTALPQNFKTSEKTFWGPRGTIEYTRNNMTGRGDSLTFSGLAARLSQNGSIVYTDPALFWTNWTSSFSINGQHNSENPIFTFREAQFGYELQRPLNGDRNQNLFLRYNFTETGITDLLIPDLVPPDNLHVRLSTLSASYIRDTRDNPTDAHKGIYESFELDFNPRALGSNFNFTRLLAQAAYYKKIPADIIWANSVRVGLEQSFSGSSVPLSETFFSGGGSTLRGFPLNGAGPQRVITACGNPADQSTCAPITVPVGGPELLIVNSELRIPVNAGLPIVGKNLGFAAFYDGGNVFSHIGFHDFGGTYSNSVGLGLRYKTPVGPIRIDVGHNLNADPGIKSTQFFITLGQAF